MFSKCDEFELSMHFGLLKSNSECHTSPTVHPFNIVTIEIIQHIKLKSSKVATKMALTAFLVYIKNMPNRLIGYAGLCR